MTYPDMNRLSDTLQVKGEVWRPVVGWEGLYSISNLGRVRREMREVIHRNQAESFEMTYPAKILKAHPDSRGYPQVCLNGKHFNKKKRVARVHRLVAEAFLENPENKPQVNHKDSNTMNPHVENLEWCTASENQIHSYGQGVRQILRGTSSGMNKHDIPTVIAVYKEAKAKTMSQEKIGKKYGIPQITVSNILTKKTWSHVTDDLD